MFCWFPCLQLKIKVVHSPCLHRGGLGHLSCLSLRSRHCTSGLRIPEIAAHGLGQLHWLLAHSVCWGGLRWGHPWGVGTVPPTGSVWGTLWRGHLR